MDLKLQGKRVLVTGASKGIGRAVADAFAAEKAHLVLVARDERTLHEVRASIVLAAPDVTVDVEVADLSAPGVAERLVERHPDVDVVVNNAGAIPPGALSAIDEAAWRAAWDLKVFGYINMCRAFYAAMKVRGGGTLVNVIGVSAMTRDPNYICGVAGNAALTAFTQSLGSVSHHDGIRVVGVSPGPVATERLVMLNRAKATQAYGDPARHEELQKGNPFGRSASPSEIGHAVAFLASPLSAYTSGTVLAVDGGLSARRGPVVA